MYLLGMSAYTTGQQTAGHFKNPFVQWAKTQLLPVKCQEPHVLVFANIFMRSRHKVPDFPSNNGGLKELISFLCSNTTGQLHLSQ